MKEKILFKTEIPKFYKELSANYSFYGPTNIKGNIVFNKIDKAEDIVLDFYNSKVPPKEVLFPKMETIFEYKKEGDKLKIEEPKDLDDKKIIFGVRPCDAHSFVLLENFFEFGQFKDNLFLTKRKNSIIIGMSCNHPRSTCFCTSLDGGPFKRDDMDIFLVDLGDRFLVRMVSEKGTELLKPFTWLQDAKDNDLEKEMKLAKEAELKIKTQIDFKDVPEILDESFDNPIWKEISETCMACGTCSFLCPTCTCFDVIDEDDHYNNRGRRIRIWDTCQFCLYTLHTSGHNPRDTKIERCRNRLLHKFSYYPKNYDLIGCVGCGRCIQLCPVNNDLREIVSKIHKIKEKQLEGEIIASK
ncbi:MAG: 4Fe-4S dicluster domain-containing protein [Promethearchaeota archaeon]